MKNLAKWLLAAPLLVAAIGAYAVSVPLQPKTGTITTQNLVSGGTATAGSCVETDVSTAGAIRVQTFGTYTAAGGLSLRETVDGVHWITDAASTTITRQSTGVQSATITSGQQDIYLVAVTGARRIGICAAGAVTGTATITIQPTELSLGGGGSSGGGGGAVTVADGADGAQGTTTDTKCASSSSTCTEIALLKTLLDPNADLTNTQTPVAPATATATKGVLSAGQYNSTPATFTNGQQGSLQLDANGYLAVNIKTGSSSGASTTAASDASRVPVDERDSLALTVTSAAAAAPTATATFTNGSANIGWTSHGLVANQTVYFTTTGSLPTNYTAGTATTNNYYVKTVVDANTFTVSATPAGTVITAGSAGSGTQTGVAPLMLFYQDLTGYESYSFQVTSAGTTCTITYETSDDSQNWIVHPGLGSSLNNNVGSTTTTTTAVGTKFGKWGKWSRARVSTYTSGTVSAVGTAHKAPFTSQLAIGAGTGFSVAGGSAQGAAVSGNPFMQGLEAYTTNPTAVTTGQTTRAMGTTEGKAVVYPYSIPELQWQKTINLTDTTSTSMNAAPGAGLRNYVTWCLISTISTTTAVQVKLLDGSTVMLPYNTPGASDAIPLGFPTPLRQPTTATAFNVQLSGSPTGAVDVTCGGFTAP